MSGGHHVDVSDPFQRRAAVAIAMYTVELTIANMLTNQARTSAILLSNRAVNQWSYFQSKSIKQNLLSVERDILEHLGAEVQPRAAGSQAHAEKLAKLEREHERYDGEKKTIQTEAQELENRGKSLERKEHFYEYGATVIELAIVLAGVSLLTHSKKLLGASLAVAVLSLCLVGYTYAAVH